MAYQVLARKWRPKQFEEVVGQGHVTRTLQNAIRQEKLAHAYLFTGTRGVGKTSIARLFAKAIRCENRKPDLNPCLSCQSCRDIDSGSSMDYVEIDGASNNSVDNVRSLIENVQYLPSRGKYKIYVIDEVHMLSVSAFNALLKTLEEPPAHTVFILATTDAQKLLGTVISRCQRYDFKNVSIEVLTDHILRIAKEENISFSSPKIVRRLAELGKGSVRDALSILDQVLGLAGQGIIDENSLSMALGLAGTTAMSELLTSILKGDSRNCSRIFKGLLDENIDLKKLCDQVLDGFYDIVNSIDEQQKLYDDEIVEKDSLVGITLAEIFWIYESLVKDMGWALGSLNPEKVVLIMLQKVCLRRSILAGDDLNLAEVPQSGKSERGSEFGASAEENRPPRIVKTWNNFLDYLRQIAPATASNLEHGNLLQDIVVAAESLSIMIAFPEDAAVFQEYVEERETYARLKSYLADFFEVDIEKIQFRVKLISHEERRDSNFKTKVEIDDEIKQNVENERRQKILNDPYVKEAEKIFNAKVDKIILND